MLILMLVPLLLIVLGVMVKYFRWYWLISGYNTMSPERKKNVDIEGLALFIGNSMFIIAAFLLLGGLLDGMGYSWGIMVAMSLMLLYIIYMLVYAQKYDHNTKTTKDRVILGVALSVIIIILGSSVVLIASGSRPQEIQVDSEYVNISGIYGTKISAGDIESVSLKEDMPNVLRKINGFDAGEVLKGNFRLEELGEAKLFIQSGKGPFVYIVTRDGGTIIINYKDPEMTRELYNKISSYK